MQAHALDTKTAEEMPTRTPGNTPDEERGEEKGEGPRPALDVGVPSTRGGGRGQIGTERNKEP